MKCAHYPTQVLVDGPHLQQPEALCTNQLRPLYLLHLFFFFSQDNYCCPLSALMSSGDGDGEFVPSASSSLLLCCSQHNTIFDMTFLYYIIMPEPLGFINSEILLKMHLTLFIASKKPHIVLLNVAI